MLSLKNEPPISQNSLNFQVRMRAAYCPYRLEFVSPATTSREVMHDKITYFIKIWDDSNRDIYGIGECALFKGLSADDKPDYESVLAECCRNIENLDESVLRNYSSIKFGIETAIFDFSNGGNRVIYPSQWTSGKSEIQINGLVWMGSFDEMFARIEEKLQKGFKCIKLKVGGIDFVKELELIKYLRNAFPANILELRLDANGAFNPSEAVSKLEQLSEFAIHSIEQPIKQGSWNQMAQLCETSPIPIALDEELIGLTSADEKSLMLETVKPQYIILKPALCGGFSGANEWIKLADKYAIKWWATSALESNIGLNAIAQWVASLSTDLPQGLGTGQLYLNNITSPIVQERDVLCYNSELKWKIPSLNWIEP